MIYFLRGCRFPEAIFIIFGRELKAKIKYLPTTFGFSTKNLHSTVDGATISIVN